VNKPNWQLTIPLDAILFDCDGTLSSIEGIDELAALAGPEKEKAVKELTAKAMGQSGINPDIYAERLAFTSPLKGQLEAVGKQYISHVTPDAQAVIRILQQLGKQIYILSAGLHPAVVLLGEYLNIPEQNIFSVNIYFDEAGKYRDFDRRSPLIHNDGKHQIVEQLKKQHRQILYVGDGMNDLAVRSLVTKFIGFGGFFYRQNIEEQSDYYIKAASMAPLLSLALTEEEKEKLAAEDIKLYEQGVKLL
jgi:phosphoserine phosphatase